MSIGATNANSLVYGLLGRLVANSADVNARLQTLTEQASTGRIAETYSGLAAGGAASLDIEPALARHQAWSNNIDAVSGRMQVTQTAMSEISSIASNFYAQTNTLNGVTQGTVDNVAAAARAALTQVAGLLDSKDGDVYVFAGQDSSNPPVPNPDGINSSPYATNIAGAVGNLAVAGLGTTLAATMNVATSNAAGTSPFSAALSVPAATLTRPIVQIGDGQSVPVGILASANADVASAGSSSSGSYIRDIMRSLATIGSLSSAQVGVAGFSGLVSDTRSSLGGAITALNGDAGVFGDRQTELQTVKMRIGAMTTAMKAQVLTAENVDMASTLSQLSQVQTQLQASYQLIVGIQSLSLTKYLSNG